MKSFTQHLLESKQVYEFKIKIAGEPADEQINKLKCALEKFTVESFSEGTRTPIQESHVDFPDHENINVSTYNVTLTYPATSFQIRSLAAEAMNVSQSCVRVRNLREDAETDINHAHDIKTGESLLGKDYNKENNQNLVGETHKLALLKELSKVKHQGEQYKGVNDKLLAKKAPVEKTTAAKVDKTLGIISPIGSRQVTLPTSKTGNY
jgi:hypothetical protein